MSHFYATYIAVFNILFVLLNSSCSKQDSEEIDSRILVKFNGEVLKEDDVINKIPIGLDSSDSIRLFNTIVNDWIDSRLLYEFGSQQLVEFSSINHQVEQYRNHLIIKEYLNRLDEKKKFDISLERIKELYEANKEKMILEEPVLKGFYIKIRENSPILDEVKNLSKNVSEENIDRLENLRIDEDFEFKYFGDKWLPWGSISEMIPYNFKNSDEFLNTNRSFETKYRDYVYLLSIQEYIPSGEIQPFEIASENIKNQLELQDILKYEESIIDDLKQKALKDKSIYIRDDMFNFSNN